MSRYLEWPRIITTVLIAGCAICVLAIGLETGWGQNVRRTPPIPTMLPAKAADFAMLPTYSLPALEAGFKESAERPLFMPSRRPVPVAAATPRMKPGQFVLVGTSRTKEFGDSAMLKEVATSKTSIVKAGATIRDMTLESVGADRIVLKLGDETEELVMKAQPRPAGPASPAASRPNSASMPIPATMAPGPGAVAAGSGIFGGPSPGPAAAPPSTAARPPIMPGAPGSPTVFPGAPGSAIAPNASQPGSSPQSRPPTPEEILERRRRARAQQAQ